MHSRFLLVMLMIAALFGMAMHAAADVAHAADAVHGDCSEQSDSGSSGDSDGAASKSKTHCCNTACHAWVPVAGVAGPVLLNVGRDRAGIHTLTLASTDGEGLRRPPRSTSKPLQ